MLLFASQPHSGTLLHMNVQDKLCHTEYGLHSSSLPAERPCLSKWFVCTQLKWVPGYFTENWLISVIISFSHLCLPQSLYCNFFYAPLMSLSNPAACPPVIWLLTVDSRIPSCPNNKGKFIQQWVMCWQTSQAMSTSFVPWAVSLTGAPGGYHQQAHVMVGWNTPNWPEDPPWGNPLSSESGISAPSSAPCLAKVGSKEDGHGAVAMALWPWPHRHRGPALQVRSMLLSPCHVCCAML